MSEPTPTFIEHLMDGFGRRINTQSFWSSEEVMGQFMLALGEASVALKDGTASLTKKGTLVE